MRLRTAITVAAIGTALSGPVHAQESRALERAIVPLVGGDTDVGIGAGALGSLARPAAGDEIFRWKLEGTAFVTVKSQEGNVGSPYQDAALQLTHKHLLGGRLRLELRGVYTREGNMRYYGMGNASVAPDDDRAARDLYVWIHPTAIVRARLRIAGPLHVVAGARYTHNWLELRPESTLRSDAETGSEQVRGLVKLDGEHGLHVLQAGLVFDSRDDEVSASAGQHHRLEVRGSPWRNGFMPYRYVGFSASASGFIPLIGDYNGRGDARAVLAVRAVGDIQMGDVPIYELARFDEGSAIGGPRYVRGIPSHRYYGKRKLLANVELRTRLWDFRLLKSDYALGSTLFFDSGRVWADVAAAPELDGTGLGLKYGTGGGLRVQKGKTFVLRVDVAWSPDARPLAGYFLAEHIF